MNHIKTLALAAALSLATLAGTAHAQATVQAKDAWVRPTIGTQRTTGAFMTLTAGSDLKLVGASSPDARVVEVHEMAMEGDVMKMRAVPALDLPSGKPVELKPGGYHLMLIDVARPMKAGTTVTVDLEVEDKDQKRSRINVKASVRPMAGMPAKEDHSKHMGH
ncbi:copper chaperone PCu(A)C [Leptothrix discophora]|uniref:Copper chaperone PCu(A)C n=1 Tax=Leptothrix discophora TaxID=89 RepID=A0ABT9FYX8_LEPDI|nr:copper chaperone PCu(A)C [Leptothrix discophora]MDP4299449.1 copper chaperone PCu(A)C [Leptothrix discophora]